MISNRRYISILIIFVTTFILFQGLLLGRIIVSDIHVNKHAGQNALTASQSRKVSDSMKFDDLNSSYSGLKNMSYTLFVGADNSPYIKTVDEWCSYYDKTVLRSGALPEPGDFPLPDIIIMSPDTLKGSETSLEWYLNRGCDVLCLALPDVDVIEESQTLQSLLGIRKIRQKLVRLKGIHLFSGFFLGGERIYEEKPGTGEEDHSLDLTVPWYITRAKTKTYLRGILSDTEQRIADDARLKNEDMPSLIWSSRTHRGTVFSVCGNYFSSRKLAFGILSAVDYERKTYSLYSVVNAQVFSFVDFPVIANENEEGMQKIYGRGMDRFEADIVVPQLQTLESLFGYKTTCFMAPKYDYDDEADAQKDTIEYFLRIIHDIEGELGLSMRYKGQTTLKDKLDLDEDYYTAEESSYPIHAAFADKNDLSDVLEELEKHPMWNSIRTISLSPSDSLPFLSYVSEHVTVQQVTSDSLSHKYFQDLELIGLETALGYDNVMLRMSDSLWPESEEDEWQNVSRDSSSNMSTYYVPFSAFDKVAISESNARVRGYLSRSYTVKRDGDVITLSMPEYDDTASFVLRTHDELITSIEGGSFKEIENNAYLITPEGRRTRIYLHSARKAMIFPEEVN